MTRILIYCLFKITLISAFGLAVQSSFSECPSPNSIYPCYCKFAATIMLFCENITYEEDLREPMTGIKTMEDSYALKKLVLKNAFLQYFPENLFEGTGIKILEIKNSGIFALSDGEYAFKGLEDNLLWFKVNNCTYVNHWDWTQLKRFKGISLLEVSQSNMLEIPVEIISKWPLETINFRENKIKYIPQKAFSKLEKLQELKLDKNSLKTVERSMFPNPAKYLYSLELSENYITDLPIDLFHEMPKLGILDLKDNPIVLFDDQTFKPIWNYLDVVVLGNILHCDCRMSWMSVMTWKSVKDNKGIYATCNTPARLRGKNPAYLEKEDFEC